MSVSAPWTAAERLAIQGSAKAGISIAPQDRGPCAPTGDMIKKKYLHWKTPHPPFNMYEEPGEGHHFVKVTSILITNGS